ncbi:MAG: AAA family ATPase [Planctomycetota bacterium]
MSTATELSFGDFRLDPSNECLWKAGEAIPLRPKAYALLRYLADNPGRILTKSELMDAVWPDAVVGDAVLKVCVRELRVALGDTMKQPTFIETVHRRGYRFLGRTTTHAVTAAAQASAGPVQAALAGRDEELGELARALDAAHRGERQVVFVEGGPGIGKTSLTESFLAGLAPARDRWVSRGQCLDQFGPREAYLPVLEALAHLSRGPERSELVPVLERHAPTWLAQLPWLVAPDDREPLERELFGATQERMLREMAEALEALTTTRTLVLMLEDLHWADPSTVDLIAALARRPGPSRLLLLLTVRPTDLALRDHPLRRVKRTLAAHRLSREIALSRLSLEDVGAAVAALLAPLPAPDELAPWIHARTDGNPLFLVNLVDSLQERGLLYEEEDAWRLTGTLGDERVPDGVLALIEDMVDLRSEDEQRVLEAASVAGVEFATAAAAAILERDQDEIEETCERLVRTSHFLAPMGTQQLPDGTPAHRYRFTHVMYASALLARIPSGRRGGYHRRNAERGVQAYGEQIALIAGELALEFERGFEPARAIELLQLAASECARRYANREAAAHLERALSLSESLPADGRAALRAKLLEQLGIVLRSMGDMPGASEAFRPMGAATAEAGDREGTVHALLLEASSSSWHDRERCLSAIAAAERESEALEDGLLRRHAHGYAGYWNLLWTGRSPEDAAACELALATAREAGDRALESLHGVRLGWFHALGGRYRDAASVAREGIASCLAVGDSFDYLLGHYFLAWSLLHAGAFGELRRTLAEALGLAERNGHATWSVLFRVLEAWLHIEARDFDGATERAEAALERARELDNVVARQLAGTVLGRASFERGDEAQALAHFDQVLADGAERALMSWVAEMVTAAGGARADLVRGDLDAARARAAALVERAEATGERTYAALGRRTLAEIAQRAGDDERAREEMERALAHLAPEPAPLAAWRVHLAAAEVLPPAKSHLAAAAQALQGLVDSLDADDPLRAPLLVQARKLKR